MTKRTRTALFFFLVLLFSAATPALIFYSQGWRIDWKERRVAQTGALYFRTDPANAAIFINGKAGKKTDFFFGTLLIDNLLPGIYEVKIEKEGYGSWQKNLIVREKQVTEAKNVVLFPARISLKTLFDSVTDVWPSPDMSLLLLQRTSSQGQRFFSLWNPKANKEISVIPRLAFTQKIQNVQWDRNGKTFLIQFQKGGGQPLVFNEQGEPCKESSCIENILKVQPAEQEGLLSPDEKKVALTQGSELWLFYLQDDEGQPKRIKGERVFLNRFGEQIQNLSWVNNHHLLLSIGDDIRIIEIDNRDSLNTTSLGSFPASSAGGPSPRLFWDDKEKIVYVLSSNVLSVSEKLIK